MKHWEYAGPTMNEVNCKFFIIIIIIIVFVIII